MMYRKAALLLSFEALVTHALHSLGSMRGFGVAPTNLLSTTTRVDDAVASGLRYLAIALAYWLIASTVLYALARLSDIPRAIRAVEWATLPIVRRAVDRTVAVSLTVGTFMTPVPAIAQTPPPVDETYIPTPAGFDEVEQPVIIITDDIFIPPGAALPLPPTQQPPAIDVHPANAGVEPAEVLPIHLMFNQHATQQDSYQVSVGESLWSIARDRLSETTGIPPADSRIVTYWVELVAANRDLLASGDPDLIYPGEALVLPPVSL